MADTRKKTKSTKKDKEQPYKEQRKAAVKKNAQLRKNPKKFKTIDDILKEQAKAFNMEGNEILNNDQMKIMLTQMALGNARDGFGLSPSISERQKAIEMIYSMTKADINEDAIDEHNSSIQEFQIKNDDGDVPARTLGEFE